MASRAKYKSLRGMPDILPEDAAAFFWVESIARDVFFRFGYKEIRTPFLEDTEVFIRSIGNDTDIVEKEIYSFTDRGGKNISLRPEGTASIVRAYIENGWHNDPDMVKLFYTGPMFRGERPQKGRLRQFHQIGAEIIGGSDPYIDAELIFSLDTLLKSLNIKGFTVLVNSLGCNKDRSEYKSVLKKYLSGHSSGLCENCLKRAEKNVLRVLDCKNKECRAIVSKAPKIIDHLCGGCLESYKTLKTILTDQDVDFTEKSDLVRGLDYYTGNIFEVIHPSMGAQDAIAAGGRYDNLIEQMGGPKTGAAGYALGLERLLLIIDRKDISLEKPGLVVIPVEDNSRAEAFRLTNRFRQNGVPCEMDLSGRSLKGQMRRAGKDNRPFVILLGEDEIKSGKLLLKDMEKGEQKHVSFDEALKDLKADVC